MDSSVNLSTGKITPTLLKFTTPIFLSLLLQSAYGTVDLLVVSQFSSVGDISGVTIGSQLMFAITNFATGLSMGTTVLLGQYIGANKPEKTSKVVGTSIALFAVVAVLITTMLLTCTDIINSLMNTPTESLVTTATYLTICGSGAVFIVFYNLLGSIFRGIGDSKTPLITVAIAFVINVILDITLIGYFNMGAAGAATATVTAQACSVIISLLFIRKKKLPFKLHIKNVGFNISYLKNILKLGIPIAVQNVLVSISFLVVTSIINVFGVVASASVGIAEKIVSLTMLVPSSFTHSLSVFTAQNYGALQYSRAKKGLKCGVVISLIFGFIMAYIGIFHGDILVGLFTSDAETVATSVLYLKALAIDNIFVAIIFTFSGYFSGCGKTTFVLAQAIFGAFAIRIPLAYLFSTLEGVTLFTIGLSTPISSVCQIILCLIYYAYYHKKHKIV